jgi:rhodanese-related sulfurtransferase
LQDRLNAGEDLLIVDLRNGPAAAPELIRGALRISPEELKTRAHTIPRDREVILFCS